MGILWLVRIPVLGFVIVCNLSRPVDMVNIFDTCTMTWFGELCAAELALAYWIDSSSDRAAMRPLWLSGLTLFAASATPDDTFLVIVTPLYFCALLVALRLTVRMPETRVRSRLVVPWRYGVAVACVLIGGFGFSAVLTAQRFALTQWGMRLLGERQFFEAGALSFDSVLSSTFGQRNSLTRALLIEGQGDFSHLRGVAFTTYNHGVWEPRIYPGEPEELGRHRARTAGSWPDRSCHPPAQQSWSDLRSRELRGPPIPRRHNGLY